MITQGNDIKWTGMTSKDGEKSGKDSDGVWYVKDAVEAYTAKIPDPSNRVGVFWGGGSMTQDDFDHIDEFIEMNLGGKGKQFIDVFSFNDLIKVGIDAANKDNKYWRGVNRLSKALAAACSGGAAYVYMKPNGCRSLFSSPSQNPQDSDPAHGGQATNGEIWYYAELPTLMRNLNVQKIVTFYKSDRTPGNPPKFVLDTQWDAERPGDRRRTTLQDIAMDATPIQLPPEAGRDPLRKREAAPPETSASSLKHQADHSDVQARYLADVSVGTSGPSQSSFLNTASLLDSSSNRSNAGQPSSMGNTIQKMVASSSGTSSQFNASKLPASSYGYGDSGLPSYTSAVSNAGFATKIGANASGISGSNSPFVPTSIITPSGSLAGSSGGPSTSGQSSNIGIPSSGNGLVSTRTNSMSGISIINSSENSTRTSSENTASLLPPESPSKNTQEPTSSNTGPSSGQSASDQPITSSSPDGLTSASPTGTPNEGGNTATATTHSTGPDLTSSARSMSTDISVIVPLWQDSIDHPSEEKAKDLIDKIQLNLLPPATDLLNKIGPPPAGTGRDCKPNGNPVFDIFNAVKCLVDTLTQTKEDLTEAIKQNFVDVSKIKADLEFTQALQKVLDNPKETKEQQQEQEMEKSSTQSRTEMTSTSSPRSSSTTSSSSSSSSSSGACLWRGMSTTLPAEPAPQGPLTTAWFDYGISCGGNNCAKFVAATETETASASSSDDKAPSMTASPTLTSTSEQTTEASSSVVNTVIPTPEPADPTADCVLQDKFAYYRVDIYNINGWAGDGGKSLKKQEKGCGGLTGWKWGVDNERQFASFSLPLTIKAGCVERAIKTAGGPEGLKCDLQGL